MVRVLHITTEFPPVIFGGLGTAVGGLVTASARSGVAVGVLLVGGVLAVEADRQGGYGQPGVAAPTASETEQTVVGPDGVTFFQISPSDPVEAAVRVVQAWRPDVLHLHTAWVWPFAQAILDRTGLPLVYTVHSVDRAEYELGQEPGHILAHAADQERTIAVADRIIALTRNEHDLLVHYYPESRPRIHIVGNGIDDGDAAYAAVASKAPTDAPLVLYTGRLVERKGIRELLAAIPLILERAPRTRFVLAGGPPPCSGAELAEQWLPPACAPYRGQIHFTGWLTPHQIEAWYCAADVQVVPSRYEPFGMVVLEGMLYGLPMVATAVGGPLAILKHGRTGLLVPPNEVEPLAQALLRLVTDPDLRHRIGRAAAADVRRRWLWPHIVAKMQRAYHEAIGAKTGIFAKPHVHQARSEAAVKAHNR